MDITPHVNALRSELADAAELGGADARALAERLTAPMESAFRLALLDALSAATDEITREIAPGSVRLQLHGREPSFVVTLPPTDDETASVPPATAVPVDGDDAAVSRINLRLSDPLKARIEEAAAREGLSVNAWLVRAASAAVQSAESPPRSASRAPRGGQRYTGWVR